MVLVIGATGLLGSEICRQLIENGMPVRALARPTSARIAELRGLGVEVIEGDLRRRADIDRACAGVDAVISTATAMGSKDSSLSLRLIDRDAQLAVVAAARAAGVSRFVYVSVSPNLPSNSPLIRYKREVEAAVRGGGWQWTILQPSCFMEIWLGPALGWDLAGGKASIFGRGDAPVAWVSVRDVARYAVAALTDSRLANRELPIGGPEAVPPNDVVRIFESRLGRSFAVKHVPRAVLRTLGPVVSLFNEGIGSGMLLGACAAGGDVIDTRQQREIRAPAISLDEYAARSAAEPSRA
jgi:uncharacterized protein YbjT (DUF2867 family)